jgi:predicted MFS family arabinose efflux permease
MRDRTSLRIVLARFISRTGGEAAFFVGIWGKAAYEFDATAGEIALLMAVLGVAGLVGSAAAGMFIDRWGPRRVLVVAECLFAPATIGLVFVGDMAWMTAAAAVFGLFAAPAFTAVASFPPYLTDDPSRLSSLNASVETAGMAALISGSGIGGALAVWWSIDAIFWFDAITSLVAVALVAGIPTRRVHHEARTGGWDEIRRGFAYVYGHRRLRFYVLVATAIWGLFGLFAALEPLFYRDVLGRGPETIGFVNAIFGGGLVLGTVVAARLPTALRTARTVVVLLAANGLGAIVYIGTRNLLVVVVGGVIWGVIIGVFAPLVRTMIHLNSPEALTGRVMGTTQVHSEAAKLLPLAVAPALAVAIGVQLPMVLLGGAFVVGGALLWGTAADLDRTRRVPVPPVGSGTVADEPVSPNP